MKTWRGAAVRKGASQRYRSYLGRKGTGDDARGWGQCSGDMHEIHQHPCKCLCNRDKAETEHKLGQKKRKKNIILGTL